MADVARRGSRSLMDRYSAPIISLAAAMWAVDAFFRPSLVNPKGWGLAPSEVVLGETLLTSLCFLPVAGRVARELRSASWRTWLALVAIAAGPQAFATVLFTQSLTYAFKPSLSHAASIGIQAEVYLLYLLQPVFGTAMAWLFLRERRLRAFWPLAGLALSGAAMIVFSFNTAVPRAQFLAAAYVLGAVVLWAAGTVLGRYALSGVSFTTTSAMRFTLALPILLGLMLSDEGFGGFSRYAIGELPSFLGVALVPGFVAMVLYYRALRSTPASVSSFAELGYPAALFLIYSLPAPVGFGSPLQPLEVVGAVVLVAAVTGLNVLKANEGVKVLLGSGGLPFRRRREWDQASRVPPTL
ncbi:MAG: DMT family transporter [Acidimicrobiales bacterium]